MTNYTIHQKPIKNTVHIAKLAVTIHLQHDDDEILDYMTYPDAKWTGKPEEEFVFWGNPDFHPASNRHPFGVAEYTVRYQSEDDMLADAEERKLFLEGVPDGFADDWVLASPLSVVSSGRAKAIEWGMNEDAQNDDEPYPLPDDGGTYTMSLTPVK
jgi:hypothetical protein